MICGRDLNLLNIVVCLVCLVIILFVVLYVEIGWRMIWVC